MRTWIAGIVGGIVLFVWGAVAHMVTPLGTLGFERVSAEKDVALHEALRGALDKRGVYFYPAYDFTDELGMEQEPWKTRSALGPNGIIVNRPGPEVGMTPGMLGTELGFNVLEGLIAAFVLTHLASSVGYGRRVLLVTLMGLGASLAIDGSYWNWYGFPDAYFAAQFALQVGGSLFSGLAVAAIARSRG